MFKPTTFGDTYLDPLRNKRDFIRNQSANFSKAISY